MNIQYVLFFVNWLRTTRYFSNILKNNNIIPTYLNFMYYYFLRRFMSYLWLIFSEYYYIFNFLFGINFRTIIVQKKTWMIFNHSKLSIDQAKNNSIKWKFQQTTQTQHLVSVTKKTALEKKPTQTLILIWYWIIHYSHNLVVSCCLITLAVHTMNCILNLSQICVEKWKIRCLLLFLGCNKAQMCAMESIGSRVLHSKLL